MASILREIARRAGVSVATVTRVLAQEGDYRRPFYAERAERIRAIADDLNYRPNLAARAMKTGRFGSLALIGGRESGVGHLGPQVVDGVCIRAAQEGQLVYVARFSSVDLADPRRLPPLLRRRAVDGILLVYTHRVPQSVDDLEASLGIPVVWLNHGRDRDTVRFADREAAELAVQTLVSRGHRRILCYAPGHEDGDGDQHYAGDERIAGYRSAMAAAGLQPIVRTTPPDRDADYHARILHGDLAGRSHPTAVLCLGASDLVVYGAMRRGLRVPEDVSVCTFTRYRDKDHDLPVARLRTPDWDLGAEAVAMLLRRIDDPGRHEPALRLPVPLVDDRFLVAREEA